MSEDLDADEGTEPKLTIAEAANVVAESYDADIFIFNFEIMPPVDWLLIGMVGDRKRRRKNLVLILVTEGGLADSAFRMMRVLQGKYERITIVVSGWCKSAGTLMCIGAHELMMGELGELGPLDVQIAKPDELGERTSGLAVETAFEKLRQEASNLFLNIMTDISESQYPITLKTASHIATELTVGFVSPIFGKLDPVAIAEDYRSNRIAHAYAERLNLHTKALNRRPTLDALEKLLSGYPSHGFVIDETEASTLFRNVKPLPDDIVTLIDTLGKDAVMPRNHSRGQTPKLEYLSDEPQDNRPEADLSASAAPSKRRRGAVRDRNGTAELPGAIEPGTGAGEDVSAAPPVGDQPPA